MKDETFDVPPQGSLGLLALGHIGLWAWKNAREKYEQENGVKFQCFYSVDKPLETQTKPASDYLNPENEAS